MLVVRPLIAPPIYFCKPVFALVRTDPMELDPQTGVGGDATAAAAAAGADAVPPAAAAAAEVTDEWLEKARDGGSEDDEFVAPASSSAFDHDSGEVVCQGYAPSPRLPVSRDAAT